MDAGRLSESVTLAGEDERSAGGDHDRVLFVGRRRAIGGSNRPSVGPQPELRSAGGEHRLDRETRPGVSRVVAFGAGQLNTVGFSCIA
jgi:hypothetical protein